MFSTPPKLFYLPSYAVGLAQVFADAPSPIPLRSRHYNSRVLDFVDVEATQEGTMMVVLAIVFEWPWKTSLSYCNSLFICVCFDLFMF